MITDKIEVKKVLVEIIISVLINVLVMVAIFHLTGLATLKTMADDWEQQVILLEEKFTVFEQQLDERFTEFEQRLDALEKRATELDLCIQALREIEEHRINLYYD